MLATLRLLLLGLHCACASVLGLLIGLCRPFNPDNSRICALIFARPALRILGIKVQAQVSGLHEMAQPCVIIANHQSNHDLFVIGGLISKRTVSFGKKSLKWIPLFGQLYWLAGNIMVQRGNAREAREAIKITTRALTEQNTSICIFPEGTRNQSATLLPFKKGAFQMAMSAGVPIVPMCTSNYATRMDLNAWHSVTVKVRCLPPIPTQGLTQADLPALMADCQARMAACIAELDRSLIDDQTQDAAAVGK
jgi:1-acyl-sn-glycerol-3-phosphate acyltransferase